MKIAVEGCCHGELDKIYETITHLEKEQNIKVDLLLICGDFQAVRNRSDFHGLAVPPKFQKLNTFYKYYSGESVAPVLTVFIGGNHEASNYLQELPYGGWVAPKIYYMGYAGVLQFGGVRIGGLSGIYKGRDYNKGHYERLPYDDNTKRSVYHVRNLEVFRLKQTRDPIDIFISHDWPLGVYNCGNVNALLRYKPFFREDIEAGQLGSPPAAELLRKLQPEYWFSAHLHVKFPAVIKHENLGGESKQTNFLALDKCLPRRKFLQIVDIPSRGPKLELSLDPEWLSILKSTNHLLNLGATSTYMPGPGSSERFDFSVTAEERRILEEDFGGEFAIPPNFERTAPPHDAAASATKGIYAPPPEMHVNPQTTLICEMLGITDPTSVFMGKKAELGFSMSGVKEQSFTDTGNDSDDVSDDVTEVGDSHAWQGPIAESGNNTLNPDQIALDSDDNDDGETGNGDNNGGKSSMPETDTSLPVKSPLRLPAPSQTSGGINLPKPVNSTPDVPMSEGTETDITDVESSQAEKTDSVKTDIAQNQEESPVPPVKKFKRRNQSMYENNENE